MSDACEICGCPEPCGCDYANGCGYAGGPEIKITGAIQECSGLRVRIEWVSKSDGCTITQWVNPPWPGLSRERAERLIEEQNVKVVGR